LEDIGLKIIGYIFEKQIRKLLISEKKQRKYYTFVFFQMDENIAYFKLI